MKKISLRILVALGVLALPMSASATVAFVKAISGVNGTTSATTGSFTPGARDVILIHAFDET